MRIVRLHPLFSEDGAIGAESVSVETPVDTGSTEIASVQETQTETIKETPESKESESSFAKRLREHSDKEVKAAREAWEKETGEKYKDYDTLKDTAEFFRERHGYNDHLSMKEDIELAKLQAKAEANNISPEMQKRLETLEAKAAKGDELEQKFQQEQVVTTYFSTLNDFVKDKGVTPEELNQFMIENQLQYNPNDMNKSFDIAMKAFKADEAITKLATAKEDAIKEYLASKKAPRVEGAPGTASVPAVDTRKMSWDQVNNHALERVKAGITPQ